MKAKKKDIIGEKGLEQTYYFWIEEDIWYCSSQLKIHFGFMREEIFFKKHEAHNIFNEKEYPCVIYKNLW